MRQKIVIFDLETGSVDPHTCQVTEFGAIAIDTVSMTVADKFSSLCKPVDMSLVQDEALRITNIKKEDLEKAPGLAEVFSLFANWMKRWCVGTSQWDRPIMSGWNVCAFDSVIINRLCETYNKGRKLFHPNLIIDLMHLHFLWTHDKLTRFSMETAREHYGISQDGAHRATYDCENCADILLRYLNYMSKLAKSHNYFEGCFK